MPKKSQINEYSDLAGEVISHVGSKLTLWDERDYRHLWSHHFKMIVFKISCDSGDGSLGSKG
jgi:hypothetical protein